MTFQSYAADATELVALYRNKDISPVDVVKDSLDRIASLNDAVNAFVFIDEESALADARASEARWTRNEPLSALDGVPTSIKDIMSVNGWTVRKGSKTEPGDVICENDSPTVAKLRGAGAVLLGLTNTPEFGWKGVTDNPLYGATRNAWDLSKTAGGSSGGAAAAAALEMGLLHVGTDGGGSVRIPASFSGVFGLKPTFGVVPVYPVSSYGTISHIGPLTKTVRDAALMMNVIGQPDHRDWYSLPQSSVDYVERLTGGVSGLTIAYSPNLGFATVDTEVAETVAAAAERFQALGAKVEYVNHVMDNPTAMFRQIWYTGAAHAVRNVSKTDRSKMDPGLVAIVEEGEALNHMDYVNTVYERRKLGVSMKAFHQKYDLLLTPTEPITAFDVTRQTPHASQENWIDWTPFTFPFNLTKQPAASINCGFSRDGLPIGLQIVGRLYEDALVLRAARAFEETQPASMPPLIKQTK